MENNKNELKQRICSYSKEFDVDLDYQENLEPYNDEMLKVLRSSVTNSAVNTEYNNGVLTVHGKSKIQITYFNNNDKGLSSVEFDEDFDKEFRIDAEDNAHFDIRISNKYCSARIINPTRIDVHNSFIISVKAYTDNCCSMVKNCDNVLLKEKKIGSISYVSSAQIKTEFDDEAQISADSPSINRIINTFSNAIEEESKIVENKMLVKSKVSVSVLYLTDSSTYERYEKTIAVNSILDIQGAAENDIAFNELTLSSIYVKPKADKNNQYRSFEIIGEMIINSAVYRETELTLPVDAYSIKNTAKPEFSRLSLNSEYSVINDSITEKFVINSDKQSITRVLDLSAAVFSDNSIEISAFIADENNNISLISSRNKTELSGFNEISINILSADYVITSENEIEVRINMAYKALKYNSETVEVINKVEIAESAPIASPALTVYFAESGEEIWDIAKRFKTSKELIKKENELTKETIDSKRILIIPGM